MSLKAKQAIIAVLGFIFLLSLVMVQWIEVTKRRQEAGITARHVAVPEESKECVSCHQNTTPGIISHWKGSTHAMKGIGCVKCHKAEKDDADAFFHYGETIATIVTPKDCARCHKTEAEEFMNSHHAKAGNILESLDNFLAETVEGSRTPFNPHSKTPGRDIKMVNGMASVDTGCKQCHGSKIGLVNIDGGLITVDELSKAKKAGDSAYKELLDKIKRVGNETDDTGKRPVIASSTWPNSGIGRLNLDGSRGSCSACHSRHDFSPRRARQPENCGKCHLGPDHPQKEIYEESKHGVAYRDLKHKMNLDSKTWILGKDYSAAPTCATCHMSANLIDKKVTHDPGTRISWTNRPPVSAVMDTDEHGKVIKEKDPTKRAELLDTKKHPNADSWQNKRQRMKNVCSHCHTGSYVDAFYKQYDDFVINYNEKFGKPSSKIMKALKEHQLLTKTNFDEEIEWTWFYLWHHEGRRARHGASMMAPDYAHWHGMYEVAERFYMEFIPQAREIVEHAKKDGKTEAAEKVHKLIEDTLNRPEHKWFEEQKKKRTDSPKKKATPEKKEQPAKKEE